MLMLKHPRSKELQGRESIELLLISWIEILQKMVEEESKVNPPLLSDEDNTSVQDTEVN